METEEVFFVLVVILAAVFVQGVDASFQLPEPAVVVVPEQGGVEADFFEVSGGCGAFDPQKGDGFEGFFPVGGEEAFFRGASGVGAK